MNTLRESAIVEKARHGLVETRTAVIACQEDNQAVIEMDKSLKAFRLGTHTRGCLGFGSVWGYNEKAANRGGQPLCSRRWFHSEARPEPIPVTQLCISKHASTSFVAAQISRLRCITCPLSTCKYSKTGRRRTAMQVSEGRQRTF